MDKKNQSFIASFFFSTRLMAVLFLVFALAMGIGTFIENDYNTDTARILIYNSWWFETIMVFFVINFIGNIQRYQLFKKEKWATLLLHLSFLFIIAGAFVTRYISYEGMMPIREGATANQIFSDKTYLTVFVDGEHEGEMKRKTFEKPLLLSPVVNNDFSISDEFSSIPFEIKFDNFIMNAQQKIVESKDGVTYLKMVEAGNEGRHDHYLKSGELQNIHNLLFSLNKYVAGAINITTEGDKVTIQAPFEGNFMRMADKLQGKVVKNTVQPLMFRSLYNMGGAQFVFPDQPMKGKIDYVSDNDFKNKKADDALTVKIISGNEEKTVTLLGDKGKMGEPQTIKIGKLEYTVFFGSKVYELPFTVTLNDFIADKYPGTENSYSAFESKVTVKDGNEKFDARIFMNNILDYKGFRLFQASFDPDEKGTVLSVNHDFWGTWITYIGYFLLFFGLIAVLFTKDSRFADLKRKLEKVKNKKANLITLLFLTLGMNGFAQHNNHQGMPTSQQIDSLISKFNVSEEHAAKFGRLVIQDERGRMKPINTFSSELLRKVSKSDTYKNLNSDQVFLSITQMPEVWYSVPMIYLKKGNDSIRKIIGVEKDAKYAAMINFFDEKGNYKLTKYLGEASRAAVQNQFQKDFLEADKKVNLLYSALSGSILRLFPIPNDKNNKWISPLELEHSKLNEMETMYIRSILPMYFNSLRESQKSGNYKMSDEFIESINGFQKKFGSKVRPTDQKIDSEILYNKYDVFKRLFYLYMSTGILMLLFTITNIFFDKKPIRITINVFHVIIGILFGFHTLGLIARWYISGHAPWSDAYESMIYVAWATMFFTLLFDRKSKLTVASGTFVASMILMIAHWNWMDPAIANLQPVLNSYWLMIHVAIIVASYGPFTLGMILGLVSLILMLFTNEKNKAKMKLNIQEITYINEMALTIGLVMLTIGNFLGGQWANESWGRYWGWDPKETWALISIMIYAFVIHARFVPALRGRWIYNVMSIFAFYSIMMTYFGVNFYLTGLHSYASGDKVVTPDFVYYSLGFVTLLSIFSYIKNKKYLK